MQNESQTSIGEILNEGRTTAVRNVVIGIGAFFLLAALVYTGIHNYNLFARYLPADQKLFALIPVILIEGSVIAFIVGSFVWFGFGTQKLLAQIFGWVLFAVAGANTLIDSIYQAAENAPEWLGIYAFWVLPVTPVVVAAMWKLIFDTDPRKRAMDAKMAMRGAIEESMYKARMRALGQGGAHSGALDEYGAAVDRALADLIRGSSPQLPAGTPAPTAQMAAEKPEAAKLDSGAGEAAPPLA
jgi:hypothetical protein